MKLSLKKALRAAVLAALTTMALTAFASAEGQMAIGVGCTTGSSLRLRAEASTSSGIVTTLNKSVAVALLDDSIPGWYKIDYNGSTGYVSADYLIIDQDNILACKFWTEEFIGCDRVTAFNYFGVVKTSVVHTHIYAENVCKVDRSAHASFVRADDHEVIIVWEHQRFL